MMASTHTQPTILLVQGSFQLPDVYEKLTKALKSRGYPVVHPHLPSLLDPDKPDFASKTLSTDALAIQSVLQRLVEEETRDILVLMHSYGGLVGIEAVLEQFSREWHRARGLAGGVFHLFFVAGFILSPGESVLDVFGESPNNDIRAGGRFRIKNPAQTLYSDLPPEEAEERAAKIIDQSYAVQTTKLTRAAYRYVPSTYVVCENDQGPPPQFQEMLGKNAGAAMLRISSGHSPMLSKTEELADMVAAAAQRPVMED